MPRRIAGLIFAIAFLIPRHYLCSESLDLSCYQYNQALKEFRLKDYGRNDLVDILGRFGELAALDQERVDAMLKEKQVVEANLAREVLVYRTTTVVSVVFIGVLVGFIVAGAHYGR